MHSRCVSAEDGIAPPVSFAQWLFILSLPIYICLDKLQKKRYNSLIKN